MNPEKENRSGRDSDQGRRALLRIALFLAIGTAVSFAASYGLYRGSEPVAGTGTSRGYLEGVARTFGKSGGAATEVRLEDDVSLTGVDSIELRTSRTDVTIRRSADASRRGTMTVALQARIAGEPAKAVSASGDKVGSASSAFEEKRESGALKLALRDDVPVGAGVHIDLGDDSEDGKEGGLVLELPADFHGAFDIRSVSGAVRVRDVDAKAVEVTTTSGDILIERLSTPSLKTKSISGDAKLAGSFAAVEASSTSGEIDFSFAAVGKTALPKMALVKTVSGDVSMRFPAKPDLDYRLTTVSGELTLPTVWSTSEDERTRAGRTGAGTSRLEVKTVSGDVTLE